MTRWLVPVAAIAVVSLALVGAGVISLSTLLAVAAVGGCAVMHLVGGHGTHAGPGSGTTADRASPDREERPSRGCH